MDGLPVHSGTLNLSTGNLQLEHGLCGWGGRGGGLDFSLYFNSQSTRSTALGAKWSHAFNWFIAGVSPAIVVAGDGTETPYALLNGQYVPPAGIYDGLVRHQDGTWTLTLKGGTQRRFLSDGRLQAVVDLNGNTIGVTWSANNVTQVSDAAGRLLVLGYTSGRLTSVTDAEGWIWTLTYDGSGRVQQVRMPALGGQVHATQYAYAGNNNVASVTNRLGRTWQFGYAANNVLASMTDPLGRVWYYAYSMPGGGEQAATDTMQPTEPPMTPGGWPVGTVAIGAVQDPTGAATQHGLDSDGRLTALRDANGLQTCFVYDAAHNLTAKWLPSGADWHYTCDARGNRLTETDPLGMTVLMSYANDRLTSLLDPLGNLTQYAYDAAGNLTLTTDPLGNATHNAYYPDGSVAQTIDPAGKATLYQYDANGNLASVADPLGNIESQSWANTRLVSRTDPRNRTTQYAYDAWGRLTGTIYPAGGSAPVALTYDVEGRLTQAVDGTGTRAFTYDDWGRRTGCTTPAGSGAATYDAAGRLTWQVDVSGRAIAYANDPAGRLTGVSDPTSAASYGWTADGQVSLEIYPNGTRKEVSYDAAGRATQIVHRIVATGAVIVGYAATYDAAGRLAQVVEQPSGDITTYHYDAAGRILSENRTGQRSYASQYAYDSRGNRTTAVRSEGGVTTHDGVYSYDDAGRLVQVFDAATNATETYVWHADSTLARYPGPGYARVCEYDEEGRLVRIGRDFGGGNVQLSFEYGYGYDGARRWRKDYTNNLWTRYPCGAASCAGELLEQTSPLSGGAWTTSAQILKGLSIVRRNAEVHHFDLLGAAGVITGAGGAVVSSALYDAFGVARFAAGHAATPWRWMRAGPGGGR
ncbi:MAG TPA: DUF6531 domain-containing protein [Chthonomonadales bacterium]|nr:DUF6531 domain-containing protein [Chthonomonadales bacterium]